MTTQTNTHTAGDVAADLVTTCPHCGRPILTLTGYIVQADANDPRQNTTRGLKMHCDCRAAKRLQAEENAVFDAVRRSKAERTRAAIAKRRFANSGMPENWSDRGMHAWQVSDRSQQNALAVAQSTIDACRNGKRPASLYIAGDIGAGKTFLASCIAVDLTKIGVRVIWRNVSDVLREIRATYDRRDISEQDVIDSFVAPDILILDDLGKERPTEWAIEQLFSIFNARYDRNRPIIVTTNYGGAELARRLTPAKQNNADVDDTTAQAIVDRLRGTSTVVVLQGDSRR